MYFSGHYDCILNYEIENNNNTKEGYLTVHVRYIIIKIIVVVVVVVVIVVVIIIIYFCFVVIIIIMTLHY